LWVVPYNCTPFINSESSIGHRDHQHRAPRAHVPVSPKVRTLFLYLFHHHPPPHLVSQLVSINNIHSYGMMIMCFLRKIGSPCGNSSRWSWETGSTVQETRGSIWKLEEQNLRKFHGAGDWTFDFEIDQK